MFCINLPTDKDWEKFSFSLETIFHFPESVFVDFHSFDCRSSLNVVLQSRAVIQTDQLEKYL